MSRFVLFLGLPGSGKGTQARLISARYPVIHVSCGDVFRAHVRAGTPFGVLAGNYLRRGLLTPDEHTCSMFTQHLSSLQPDIQVILEGFPRTPGQVATLDKYLAGAGGSLAGVIHLALPIEVATKRIADRLICEHCGEIYNASTKAPLRANICDIEGNPLTTRADDDGDAAHRRLALAVEADNLVLELYKARGLVEEIESERSAAEIAHEIERALVSKGFVKRLEG